MTDVIVQDIVGSLPDERLAQVALAKHYITTTQLEESLREQQRAQRSGTHVRLEQILRTMGYLTTAHLLDLLASQNANLRVCMRCERVYDASRHSKGLPLRCLQCGDELKPQTEAHSRYLRLGKYVLTREIARGGMGIVFEVEDPELKRRIALKILKEGDAGPDDIVRLHREAAIAAQLQHPNIVGIHEVGTVQDDYGQSIHFIAMDYVEGETLQEILHHKEVPRVQILKILETVARAAAYAHSKGIIHRDLKPSNIILDQTGRAVLTDFGLARAENFSTRLTRSQMVMGTPHYMAPEQVEGRIKDLNERTDVYALGVILYEILARRLPFQGENELEIYHHILQDDPAPPSRIDPSIERDLDIICLKAMAKEQERRYATAGDLADDLERFLTGEPVRARPPSAVYTLRKRLAKRKALVGSLAGAIAAGIAVLVYLQITKGQMFERTRREAQKAFAERDWPRALAACERALGIRSDSALQTLSQKCRERMNAEENQKRQQIAEGERYRRLLEKMDPIKAAIQEMRLATYIKDISIKPKLERVTESLQLLEEIVSEPANARYAEAWTLLGMGWYFLGQHTQAEEALREAEKLSPEDGRALFYRAKIYMERSVATLLDNVYLSSNEILDASKASVQKALEYLRRPASAWGTIEEVDRHVAEAYLALAELRVQDVFRLAEQGLERFPDALGVEEFWNLRGWGHYLQGHNREAIAAYSQAIGRRPHYAWGYFMRGLTKEREKDSQGALADYDEALRINPWFVEAYINRVTLRHFAGDIEGTLADYDAILKINPGYAVGYNNRGVAREEKGNRDGALADFSEAIRLNPRYVDAYVNRGESLEKKGDPEGALADYEEALRLDPRHARAHNDRGALRYTQGNIEGALADYDEAIRTNPNFAEAYANRANVHYRRGDIEDAVNDFNQAIRFNPQLAGAYIARAFIRKIRGDLEGAMTDYNDAIRIDPHSAEAYARRGDAHLTQGNLEGAMADYRTSLKIAPPDWPYQDKVERLLEEMSRSPELTDK